MTVSKKFRSLVLAMFLVSAGLFAAPPQSAVEPHAKGKGQRTVKREPGVLNQEEEMRDLEDSVNTFQSLFGSSSDAPLQTGERPTFRSMGQPN